jgi:hypothetical protein
MKDYIRDDRTKAVFLCNKAKAHDLLEKRMMRREIEALKEEINRLKSLVEEIIAKRT